MSNENKWRGGQVTRIEALTDAVFGFSITLLFVSFEVPRDFDALLGQLGGLLSFAACFALIILVWFYHYRLFGRFDMEDGWTIVLNSLLLFVVLFYVYPLKFVFTSMFGMFTGHGLALSNPSVQLPLMMGLYGIGYVAVFMVFTLMYLHAYRRRAALELTHDDIVYALDHVGECAVMCAVGIIAVLLAFTVPWQLSGLTGFVYALIGPAQWANAKLIKPRWQARLLNDSAPTV